MKQVVVAAAIVLAAKSFAGDLCGPTLNTGTLDLISGMTCGEGGGNTAPQFYAKSYDRSLMAPGETLQLSRVFFGATNGGPDVAGRITVYLDTDGGAPQAPGIDLVALGAKDFTLSNTPAPATLAKVGFSPPVRLPADSVCVVEMYLESSTDFVGPGLNRGPDSTPTYLRASGTGECDIPTFTDLSSLGIDKWFWAQSLRTSRDCDGNGLPDCTDVTIGNAKDCDGDGVLDICENPPVSAINSPGIPTVSFPLVLDTIDFPEPGADIETVRLKIEANGDLEAPDEFLTVKFDGELLGFTFASDGESCMSQLARLDIPRRMWDDAATDQSRIIEIYASPTVDTDACALSGLSLKVYYDAGDIDCDGDGLGDLCAIADGEVPDCNDNGIPDACDLAEGTASDIDVNGVPDECQTDCNGNGQPDNWEVATGVSEDCDGNQIPDTCDIASGEQPDSNSNEVPDPCDLARGDLDLDGCVGPSDLGFMLALWGFPDPPIGDLDGDGVISAFDLGRLLASWDCEG